MCAALGINCWLTSSGGEMTARAWRSPVRLTQAVDYYSTRKYEAGILNQATRLVLAAGS